MGGPMNAPAEEAEAHAKVSKRENRLYVGNLPYDCNYKDLEKFMSGGGFGLDLIRVGDQGRSYAGFIHSPDGSTSDIPFLKSKG